MEKKGFPVFLWESNWGVITNKEIVIPGCKCEENVKNISENIL